MAMSSFHNVITNGCITEKIRSRREKKTLKKKLDPEKQQERFLETTLETHYPKVYQDMIKNDYITTGAQRIEEELEKVPDSK